MRCKLKILGLFCGLVLACSNKKTDTEIAVVVWSDLSIPADMDGIRVDVTGSTASRSLTFQLTANGQAGKSRMPLQLSLVPADGNSLAFVVKATALSGNTAIVSQEASLAFLPGQRRVLTLFLGRACAGVPCAPGLTCFSGVCAPTTVVAGNLPVYDPAHLPPPPDAAADSPSVDSGSVDSVGAEPPGVDAAADKGPPMIDSEPDKPADLVMGQDSGVDVGIRAAGTGGATGSGGAGGNPSMDGSLGGAGGIATGGSGGSTAVDAAADAPGSPDVLSDVSSDMTDASEPDQAVDTPDVATCADAAGSACGSCGGTINCDGTCSVPTPLDYNSLCGRCGGRIACSGSCSFPEPSTYGNPCGSCGGTITCAGTCSVATPSTYGNPCGSCAGTITCAGTCSIATPPTYGDSCTYDCKCGCGSVVGQIGCAGTCLDTANQCLAICNMCA